MTAREEVLKYRPLAKVENVGCNKGNKKYYEVWDGKFFLGKGKSKQAAWRSANRNL